ncbi:hypothetical protein PHYPSEUDO_004602 [Phytophthora pseudosyringae]|uniref:Uncharacterized protein n=1 Tax=Phytophthora pseudosyringae TaxID=221518 RepID=A0A8T1WBV2_9STRA|nr:hypothetical protein PHYPSEUDO_004602 [Phytophthora pseudosyringae]
MADMNRRKGGVRSQQSYMQQQAAASQQPQQFSAYQQQVQAQAQAQAQQNPYQYQQYQKQQQQQQSKASGFHPNRSGGYRSSAQKPFMSGAKMGIKSGMTVEDLKRLTQKRMQQTSASNPATPKAAAPEGFSSARPATPKINMAVVNATSTPATVATPPVVPKTGMSVQELKQLTALRVASQNVPVHASEVTGLVSKAVLNNAAKSHYRDSLRSSLTPGSTPKRAHHTRSSSSTQFGSAQYSGFGNDLSRSHGPGDLSRSHGPLSSSSSGDVIPVRGHRSRSRSSQLPNAESSVHDMPMRYSYTSGQTPEDYFSSYDFGGGGNSTSSQETDPGRGSLDDGASSSRNALLQFSEDSFPPPPPMDESGGFVSTALPSWSPPPARTKKLNASASSGATFYNQQTSYYNIASKEESVSAGDSGAGASQAQDQNAVLAPPPGLTRRPSMTVPWQVAEAVLNTPQTTSGRKKLVDPDADTSSGGLNSSAAEAAAQLTGLSLQSSTRSRGNSGAQPPPPPSSSSGTLSSSPPSSSGMPLPGGANAARRGSFGNAAEFFKFRRRSKSRLELARDMSFGDNGELGGYPSYGTAGAMPGIAERHGDAEDGFHENSASDASSSTSANDESSSQDYTDEDVVQVTGGYDDTAEISGSFVSFYNAARQQQGGLSVLSIPPPPPPPPMADEDDDASTTSSTKGNGLPMMSPNGARLRKVAELARRGSLSSEDKTRAKDEIIQSSLGIGANHAARLLATKKEDRGDRVPATAPSVTAPPGFHGIPRLTPKASAKKMLAPGSGIVRSSTAAPSSTSAGASSGSSAPSQKAAAGGNSTLEERLAAAAQRVADCVGKGDMTGFQQAMDELDWLRNEASKLMRG